MPTLFTACGYMPLPRIRRLLTMREHVKETIRHSEQCFRYGGRGMGISYTIHFSTYLTMAQPGGFY